MSGEGVHGGIFGQQIEFADDDVVVERPLSSGLWANEVRTPAEIRALDLAYAILASPAAG